MNFEMLLLRVPAILVALTIHEFAHGYIAYRFGDPTARMNGRLTLNPISHLDPFGAVMLLFGPFGWAKPVPVNARNFDNPKRDLVWVSLAGPISNVITALVLGLVYRFAVMPFVGFDGTGEYIHRLFYLTVYINLGICLFNMIPIPPLDGSNVLMGFLTNSQTQTYLRVMSRAPQVFLALILVEWVLKIPTISLVLGPLFTPFVRFWLGVIFLGGPNPWM